MAKKCYYVSGKKHGKQKMTACKSKKKAHELYNKAKSQRGWNLLGISEGDCKTIKKIEKSIRSKVK